MFIKLITFIDENRKFYLNFNFLNLFYLPENRILKMLFGIHMQLNTSTNEQIAGYKWNDVLAKLLVGIVSLFVSLMT